MLMIGQGFDIASTYGRTNGRVTEEDPCDQDVRVVPVRIFDVAETQDVELAVAISTGSMDGHQSRPGNQASSQAGRAENTQKSQKKIAI